MLNWYKDEAGFKYDGRGHVPTRPGSASSSNHHKDRYLWSMDQLTHHSCSSVGDRWVHMDVAVVFTWMSPPEGRSATMVKVCGGGVWHDEEDRSDAQIPVISPLMKLLEKEENVVGIGNNLVM
ncbi:hypothetical protein L1987_67073 [Smallanthus sonchifolius]|uniref:Uncharacterized protein n=1 Tax=Smallanthus sonchifolius TaxID=185202 RepID=A0ACB9BYV9_9ASTR|nr:hypothetical protein L1987_67073 [Smallanthus sonchifolius]